MTEPLGRSERSSYGKNSVASGYSAANTPSGWIRAMTRGSYSPAGTTVTEAAVGSKARTTRPGASTSVVGWIPSTEKGRASSPRASAWRRFESGMTDYRQRSGGGLMYSGFLAPHAPVCHVLIGTAHRAFEPVEGHPRILDTRAPRD